MLQNWDLVNGRMRTHTNAIKFVIIYAHINLYNVAWRAAIYVIRFRIICIVITFYWSTKIRQDASYFLLASMANTGKQSQENIPLIQNDIMTSTYYSIENK